MIRKFALLSLLLTQFPILVQGAADRIEALQVKGNVKTNSSVIKQMSELEIGQEVTETILQDSKERVSSSGIFEEVLLSRTNGTKPGWIELTFIVKEKMSWFVAPSLQFSEDALSGGIVAGESNLFGLNKKAVVFADYGPSNRRFYLGYRDPSVLNSRVVAEIDAIIRWDRMIEYQDRIEVRRIRLLNYGATVLPGYKWSSRFTSSIGAYWRHVDHNLISEASPSRPSTELILMDGEDFAIVIKFEYENMKNFEGLLHGAEVSAESALSDNRFGSDFNYFKQEVRFTSGYTFEDRQYAWLQKASIQLGRTLPYYREYTLGGMNLRGFVARQFRGDTKYTLNEEFYYPIHRFNRFILRGLLFWDSGILYFKDDDFSRTSWNNGVGGGLRLFLKGIAIPLLGFDVGWGIEDKQYSTYLNLGTTF